MAGELDKEPLWIFPRFEVDIGYHVLCFFPPTRRRAKAVARADETSSVLGLTPRARFDRGKPRPLRQEGAPVSLRELLKTVPRLQLRRDL